MKIVREVLDAGTDAYVTGYLHDISWEMKNHRIRPCVVVCPGGGYEMLSDREKEPPAFAWFAAGYQVFTLNYSVGELAGDLGPLMELSETVLMIRRRAGEWQIKEDQIAVMGFSAGGHLAASLGTLWNSDRLKARMDTENGRNRPNAMILSYPVITAGEYAHQGSLDKVSGGVDELKEWFSLEKRVTADTPPAFLWHTADDTVVPVENTLLFGMALKRACVPFECHVFPSGTHGLSMCNYDVDTNNDSCSKWVPLSMYWLNHLFGYQC